MEVSTNQIFNFNAGPAMLPAPVMQIAQEEFLNYRNSGMSVMEMSHRGGYFQEILDRSLINIRKLLNIPDSYEVIFCSGGATAQFTSIPMNLLDENETAAYSLTGVWSNKAYQEAKRFYPNVVSIFDGKLSNFSEIPELTDLSIPKNSKYAYITSNNTIYGTRYSRFPKLSIPLIADMTSDILSRELDVSSFGVIFAGAQKNIGPSGLSICIIRKDLLHERKSAIPVILDWRVTAKAGSLYNTPPTYSIYMAGLVFEWLLEMGGLSSIEKINEKKASLVYNALDESEFYRTFVPQANRSIMNVVFHLKDSNLDSKFVEESEKYGLIGLKGYRDVGGMRASIYNAMPLEGVERLVSFLKDFEKRWA
ncbi:MAG: 3-phosphoserine/phosphohydroxythreonine transaminase [Leptospira sp.]|jgi:phosphoserine aminotransferase|nr:3-phosphoserine/phosphohydroxythreonine transaminase [Leptospira sp.]NCS93374.1 3-phosphoserine/phosphohydroxythreonine transaminase [Leptospira sp.]